ncbi:MAG: metal-dependent hydrolase [Armatimonadetes bacterium]|nr:metal-dependent hydrolase [Armatimonadota bacterium]
MPTPYLPQGFSLTYLGHSTVLFETEIGARVLIDPFVENNPRCPLTNDEIGDLDLILLTHTHDDHFADCLPIAIANDCYILAVPEVCAYLGKKGIAEEKLISVNKGGTVPFDDLGFAVTMTHADHTTSINDNGTMLYAGEPMGFVISVPDGDETFSIYHAGDTAIFGDMRLISEIYTPRIALLPIGDHYTMGPREAASASALLASVEYVIPIHYGTFPMLTGTPDKFREALAHVEATVQVAEMEPGQTIHG